MKKFSKLLAVLVALAVIICPMTSAIVANATANGGTYSIVAEDANNVVLTIGSNDGFIVYQATVTFNNDSAFQNSYSDGGYTNGLKVIDYTLVSAPEDEFNAPAISAQQNGSSLVILVSATDAATLDLYSEVQIGIRVASGSTANLTKIQAADEGTVEEDPSLLNFGTKVAADGTVDTENNDDATTGTTHEHDTAGDPEVVTAPGCTTTGSYYATCSVCHERQGELQTSQALGHDYGAWSHVENSDPPQHSRTCSRCDAVDTQNCNSSGTTPGTAATCGLSGTTDAHYCTVCNFVTVASTTIPATGNHTWVAGTVTPATCVAAGSTHYTCSVCNAEKDEPIAATGVHTWGEYVSNNDATCTVDGTKTATCTVCGVATNTITDTGSAKGHSFTSYTYNNDATCTAAGTETASCDNVCGTTDTRTSAEHPATGHTPVTDAAVAATCVATGLTEGSHCSVCSAVLVAQTETPIDPTNHTNIVNDAAVAATCTETGLTAGSHCAACDTTIVAQSTVPALGHNYTYTDHGDGTHDIGCTRCDYAANEACVDANDDGYCDLCNAQLACEHNYVGVVTTQPTKNATGVMTYTCSLCGDSYTEPIAIPTVTSAVTFSHTLLCSEVVGDQITVSTKQMRTNFGDAATYFIDINYQTYSSPSALYDLANAHTVLTASDKDTGVSTANKDVLCFDKMALFEMTAEFDMTLYIKNASGVVVAYRSYESSIAELAYTLATQNTSKTNLLTCLADMCNYGKAVQDYFAATNPTKDIAEAADPTTIFADYMAYASDISILPGAGEYDNTKVQSNKVVTPTGFISAGITLSVGASNQITYTVRADDYDLADCEIVMSYTSIYGSKEFTVNNSELLPNGTTSAGKQKYSYTFKNLSIYDVNAVVTMSMYHNGVLEMTSQYSAGNFVNTYIEQASPLGVAMRAMELFANSAAIQLGAGSIFS